MIELLLPLTERDGQALPAKLYQGVRETLKTKFGSLTVYARYPATGFWERDHDSIKDQIIIFEVMVDVIDTEWWREYRKHLEEIFQQETILIRATDATIL